MRLFALLPALALPALPAAAQPPAAPRPLVGVVIEQGNGLPVPGAMAMLFDESGERVDRMLTNAAGRFILEPRGPGAHHVTVERIGYASLTTPPFDPAAQRAPMTIEVPVKPVELSGLDVSAGRRCEVRPEEGRATAQVWDEVRKALAAEAWTREAGLYRYTLLRFDRRLDREAENVLSDVSQLSDERDAAFYSLAIETLADEGFVQAEGDSMTVYYAPDAGALLSDPFLDTHCLGLTDEAEGLIGLTFEPVEGRRIPDIAGILWLDEATAELDRLVFHYVNLLDSDEIGEPGGEVYFARLPDGAWIVRQWRIRMPTLEAPTPWHVVRLGYREEGGITDAITDARGRTVLSARAASVFGVVIDSVGTDPPEPMGVEIADTRRLAVTENDGSFLFSPLPPGTHRLRVISPVFANWGIAVPETAVQAEIGEVAYARLRAPTIDDVLTHSCGGAPRPDGTANVLGRIVAGVAGGSTTGGPPPTGPPPAGPPPRGLRVEAAWPAATGYAPASPAAPLRPDGGPTPVWTLGRDGHYATATTTTDGRGQFLLCGVPHGARLRVAVLGAVEPLALTTLFVPPGSGALVETLSVSIMPDTTRHP